MSDLLYMNWHSVICVDIIVEAANRIFLVIVEMFSVLLLWYIATLVRLFIGVHQDVLAPLPSFGTEHVELYQEDFFYVLCKYHLNICIY